MSELSKKSYLFFSNPSNMRWVTFGLMVAGLLVSLGAPDPVAACTPPTGGTSGCAPQ